MSDEMQQRHAAKIRTERALIEITGWSRSQARANLATFTRSVAAIQATPKAPVPLKESPEVKTTVQKFEAKTIPQGILNRRVVDGGKGAPNTSVQQAGQMFISGALYDVIFLLADDPVPV